MLKNVLCIGRQPSLVQRCRVNTIEVRRFFFSVSGSGVPKLQTYKITKVLPHSPQHLYSIVSNVDGYHEFLPYCNKSYVTQRNSSGVPTSAVLSIGWNQFAESFESKLDLDSTSIAATAHNTPLFTELYTKWAIKPLNGRQDKCIVDFVLKFAFKSVLYQAASHTFGSQLSQTMVKAFTDRAAQLEAQRTENA